MAKTIKVTTEYRLASGYEGDPYYLVTQITGAPYVEIADGTAIRVYDAINEKKAKMLADKKDVVFTAKQVK